MARARRPGAIRTPGPRRTWSTATSRRPARISFGSPTSPMCLQRPGSSTSPSCSTPGAARSSAGRWRMRLRAELVLDAMEAAVGQRRPKDVIHHSDQGSQYTSVAFGKRCGEAGVRPSMGSVGDACDNAMAESFFSTLEAELLSRRRFASQAEARMACFSYIEGWYNPARLHSGLGYRSPMTYKPRARPPRSSRSQQARKLSTRTGRPHFASGRQVPVFLTEACLEVTPPSCRTPVGPSAGTSQPLLAGQKCRSRFRRRLNT